MSFPSWSQCFPTCFYVEKSMEAKLVAPVTSNYSRSFILDSVTKHTYFPGVKELSRKTNKNAKVHTILMT